MKGAGSLCSHHLSRGQCSMKGFNACSWFILGIVDSLWHIQHTQVITLALHWVPTKGGCRVCTCRPSDGPWASEGGARLLVLTKENQLYKHAVSRRHCGEDLLLRSVPLKLLVLLYMLHAIHRFYCYRVLGWRCNRKGLQMEGLHGYIPVMGTAALMPISTAANGSKQHLHSVDWAGDSGRGNSLSLMSDLFYEPNHLQS